ncbi:MAG: pantoate--beta-alanine ligase, partial [Akkermansiaceae bacterium]|nr:pantoate--beta-alanine ligase [Akkermansiaceae bacterium]
LALSSRNANLGPAQRADAPRIRRALLAAQALKTCGEERPEEYLRTARHHLEDGAPADFRVDYLQLVDAGSLQPVAKVAAPALLAAAAFYGEVRLIDNVEL